jgi:catechol 2,3-dioxygenase-like lactoylglutathione lyase family enzyme
MGISVRGTNHPALSGTNYADTVDFYTRVLGMRLVLEQPNLDNPDSVHLFFETGPGQFIAYFVPRPGAPVPEQRRGGPLDHVSLNLTVPLEEAMAALDAEGIAYRGPVDRGYESSLYFKDPNDVTVELMTWVTPYPAGADEGDVILAAQEHRKARGAGFIEDEDVQAVVGQFE